MAKQTVNLGSSANDGTGDPLRSAFDKINDNFNELYGAGAGGTNVDITGNSITTIDTNGNLTLDPNGTGKVVVNTAAKLNLADHTDHAILFTNSAGDVSNNAKLTYNAGTSVFTVEDLSVNGNVLASNNSNQDIIFDPIGTGRVASRGDIVPSQDNGNSLGNASYQWLTVFANAGTFQATSTNTSTINPGSAPGSPANGMIYYDSTAHKFKGYANGAFEDLHGSNNSVQQISGPGAISLAHPITEITTTGTDAYTLANGVIGQTKIIIMKVDGGDATITPTTFATGTTITMNDVNDNITLLYAANGWVNTANQGSVIA
jgi:hypothetical protein